MKKTLLIIWLVNLFSCEAKSNIKISSIPEKAAPKAIQMQINKPLQIKDCTFVLNCNYKDLSNVFDFAIQFKRVVNNENYSMDSSLVSISILDKKHHKVDSIRLKTIHYYDFVFETCTNVRSYSTGKNKNKDVIDGDYGKFIVADFNFDALEDFAVINEYPNSGAMYTFYLQDKNRKFHIDRFLTDSVMWFPDVFDPTNNTLAYSIHCGACGISQVAFNYDSKSKKWQICGKRMIDVCEDKIESSDGYFKGKTR